MLECRRRQQRNLLTTLLLSQGVPMLLGGDEFGRTQGGNNNAYCQDNELSWYDWASIDTPLLVFTRETIRLRRDHSVFRRRHWFQGRPIRGSVDISWLRPDGQQMDDADWEASSARSVGVLLDGKAITERDQRGQPVTDDSFLILFNGHEDKVDWTLPIGFTDQWQVLVDTSGLLQDTEVNGERIKVGTDSIVLLLAMK